MANTQHRGFLTLPTELRLEVYKRLLAACLADGYPHHVRGLLRSCTKVHEEMAEYIDRILPFIKLQHYWMRNTEAMDSLHVYLPSTYEFTTRPEDVTLLIPVSKYIEHWRPRCVFDDLCISLLRAAPTQLRSLTLGFYYPLPDINESWRATIRRVSRFVHLIHRKLMGAEQCRLKNAGRLMIDLSTHGAPPSSIGAFEGTDMFMLYNFCNDSTKGLWWLGVSGTAPRSKWTLCFDLRKDMDPLVNAFGRRWTLGTNIPSEWEEDRNKIRQGGIVTTL